MIEPVGQGLDRKLVFGKEDMPFFRRHIIAQVSPRSVPRRHATRVVLMRETFRNGVAMRGWGCCTTLTRNSLFVSPLRADPATKGQLVV